ncbi:hypothetical protein LINPERHAP2_LOCUS23572 [Linum perenne]
MGIEYQESKVVVLALPCTDVSQCSVGTSGCKDVGTRREYNRQCNKIGDFEAEDEDVDSNEAATVEVEDPNSLCSAKQNGRTVPAGIDVQCSSSDFDDELDHIVLKERQRILLLSRNTLRPANTLEESAVVANSVDGLACAPATSTSHSNPLDAVEVKAEPLENVGINKPDRISLDMFLVKSEPEIPDGLHEDHMQLLDRMKLQAANDNAKSESSGYFNSSGDQPLPGELPQVKISRTRKRKKTATDSAETALEEDAPGLLHVLVEQGVTVDEIKLYGVVDGDDEPIDESFIEDGFEDLEAVMSKLFSQRNSLLKLAPVRSANPSKPSYCLGCLFSLVEQARYLRFRDWPAQWGWCRDLQSFIFVFERHNRIVLERPEYGYATYFFELVDTPPVKWQIKRLILAMKLTGCGRITLIENKALKVGEDLSEGEAKVLMQYGWTPNTGVGTMLNYCDRVAHDRKNEKDSLEWKSKIGKLLMDGYNGGTIVSSKAEQATRDDCEDELLEVKMEEV